MKGLNLEGINPVRKDGALQPALSKKDYRLIDSFLGMNGGAF
jgi:hypothetical protein